MIGYVSSAPPRLACDAIATPHGFFERGGGVSSGIYASLNCGPGSGDDDRNVEENRRRCLIALGGTALVTGYQTHSSTAAFVSDGAARPNADALVTDRPGLAIGVLTADCIPVLFHDGDAGIIGAAHAGWKGALCGILEACIDMMRQHGAKPDRITACIGPCLRPPFFQVGEDLVERFVKKYSEASRFFAEEPGGRFQCDLVGFGAWRLRCAGLGCDHIHDTLGNTLADPARWFSYRHARQSGQDDYGRNLSAIML